MTTEEYLTILKPLLGISGETKDSQLTFVIESVVQGINTYCNVSDIPEALENVVLQIAEDYYRSKYPAEFTAAPAAVVSVKRGDVETKFGASKPAVAVGSGATFVQNYAAQLNAFRKLRW